MGDVDISRMPDAPDPVEFARDFGPRFIVTVDAEEEFDWSKPLEREGHGLDTVPYLSKFQQFCEGHGVVPIYLLDYPVATSADAVAALGDAVRDGRAEVGVQLHPWVNPPFEEEVSEHNSFAGNLPPALEREKFRVLRDAIAGNFGTDPLIYRAGRYGVGKNTARILADMGMRIDTSVRARFDYSSTGGPNFRDHAHRPYWIDRAAGLIEAPLTTVYWGPLRRFGPTVYPMLWRAPRLRGVLARIGLLERIPLTPEGITIAEARRGVDVAVAEGLPLLVFSFHSPSLAPGHTPYVADEADLDAFYEWWRDIFAHLAARGVRPASVREILGSIALASPPGPS